MQPTVPPLLPSRRREYRRRIPNHGQYSHPFRASIYDGSGDLTLLMSRFDSGLERRIIFTTSPTPRLLQDRYPADTDGWRLPMHPPDFTVYREEIPITLRPVTAAVGPATSSQSHEWGNAALGWAGGSLVLALFVLLVRAAERCLDKKFFKSLTRESVEWQTPDVLATRNQHSNDPELGSPPNPGEVDGFPLEENTTVDLPPPYSKCAAGSTITIDGLKLSKTCEDPPPPYSACYVAFSNAKEGIPSVHIVTRRNEEGTSGSDNTIDDNDVIFNDSAVAVGSNADLSNDNVVPDLVNSLEESNINMEQVNDITEPQQEERVVVV